MIDVAADDDDGADLGDRPAKAREEGRHQAEPRVPEQRRQPPAAGPSVPGLDTGYLAWKDDSGTIGFGNVQYPDAERLDELLWTFRDGSFVPHECLPDRDRPIESPVTIGCEGDPVEPRDLLINLCDDIPACAEGFPRVAELVTSDDDCKQLSRRRFAAYREQGHTLETHKL